MTRALAAAAVRGEAVALVDACDTFDPASAAAQGLDLSRLLWVRESGDAPRALKAFSLVLQAGGFATTAEFAGALLDEARVAVTPGEAFDAPGFVRISYATSLENLREGSRRLLDFVARRASTPVVS